MAIDLKGMDLSAADLQKAIDAIYAFAYWEATAEGHEYWQQVADKLESYLAQMPDGSVTAERNAKGKRGGA